VIPAGVNGEVLRYNGFPENFIKTNPQFNNATLQTNAGSANYHSMQAQVTLRPVHGFTYQGTYTWSKSLGRAGGWTTPFDRSGDYTLQGANRAHEFRSFGSFDLPIGPNQLLLGGSSGTVARIVEGWSMSWFFNMGTGSPTSIAAANMLYANGVPDVVGPFDPSAGNVSWEDGALSGNYFGGVYSKVADPQCAAVTSLQGLGARCTLNAIADASGNIVLQNPLPGNRGTLGQNVVEGPGIWALDTAMSKAFSISENRRLQFRIDALNIFNHPDPSAPSLTLAGSTPFGNIASKSGNRQFKAQIRLEF
jgi:hypothetical protein